MDARYFLNAFDLGWQEVTKEQFVKAERSAGFYHTWGGPDSEPATGGFGNGSVSGRIVYSVNTKDQYSFDPEFAEVAFP